MKRPRRRATRWIGLLAACYLALTLLIVWWFWLRSVSSPVDLADTAELVVYNTLGMAKVDVEGPALRKVPHVVADEHQLRSLTSCLTYEAGDIPWKGFYVATAKMPTGQVHILLIEPSGSVLKVSGQPGIYRIDSDAIVRWKEFLRAL